MAAPLFNLMSGIYVGYELPTTGVQASPANSSEACTPLHQLLSIQIAFYLTPTPAYSGTGQ